ncbi:MAG: hypothetical protein OXC57_03940 [Rhodobacteraceae bacterium]|nr:hypothetical protein [Paracoccaceae bacterium]
MSRITISRARRGTMKTSEVKWVSVDLVPALHDDVKAMAQAQTKTLKGYVIDALMERLLKDQEEEEKEDRLWGEIAEKAVKEGFLSDKETADLMQRINNA